MARTRKSKQRVMEDFARKVTAKHDDMKFVINPEGEISLSDAISQLIEPYVGDAPNYKSFRVLVGFACIAWNATILPAKKRDEMLERLLTEDSAKSGNRAEMLNFIKTLMRRKRKLFPHISRMIVEYKVTDLGNDFHIAIASTLEK